MKVEAVTKLTIELTTKEMVHMRKSLDRFQAYYQTLDINERLKIGDTTSWDNVLERILMHQ